MKKFTLYHYWRSTSSWRVRMGLFHKGIPCTYVPIDLLKNESESDAHLKRNPMGYIPVLEVTDAAGSPRFLAESIAIFEWLEETQPEPPLLPGDAWQRARIRQLAEIINSGTQPLQNLGVTQMAATDPEAQKAWNQYWIRKGLQAYETLVRDTAGRYSIGDTLTLADLLLAPQCYNAIRFEIPLAEFPTIALIHEDFVKLPIYLETEPDRFKP